MWKAIVNYRQISRLNTYPSSTARTFWDSLISLCVNAFVWSSDDSVMLVSPPLRQRSNCESCGVMAVTGTGGITKGKGDSCFGTKGTEIPRRPDYETQFWSQTSQLITGTASVIRINSAWMSIPSHAGYIVESKLDMTAEVYATQLVSETKMLKRKHTLHQSPPRRNVWVFIHLPSQPPYRIQILLHAPPLQALTRA